MNLLVRKIVLFVFASFILFSCEDPKDIGLTPQQSVGVFFTDTLTVQTSTVLDDSVYTYQPRHLLVGRYEDTKLGKVSAKSYFELVPRSGDDSFTLGESPVADSLVLFLHYQYSYGDTTRTQQINVHHLADTIDRQRRHYNFDSVLYEDTPIGNKNFQATPNKRTDTLKIRLSDAFASSLVAFNGQSRAEFIKNAKGLVLVSGEMDNAAIVGFEGVPSQGAGASKVRLYYRRGAEQTATFYDFPIGTATATFNQIQGDRTGTNLAILQPHVPLPANQINQESYVQAGVGLRTKIEFPTLSSLEEKGNIAINRAELIIEPVQNTLSGFTPAPSRLALYRTDAGNKIIRDSEGYLVALSGDFGSQAVQQAVYNPEANTYTFLITSYVQAKLNGSLANEGIVLSLPSIPFSRATNVPATTAFEYTTSRLVVGSSQNELSPMKLRIYYTILR